MKVYILYWVNSDNDAEINSVWRTKEQGEKAFYTMKQNDIDDNDIDTEDDAQYSEGPWWYSYDCGNGWTSTYLIEEDVKGDIEEANA